MDKAFNPAKKGVTSEWLEALETAAGVEAPDCRGSVKVGGKFNRAKRRLAGMSIAQQHIIGRRALKAPSGKAAAHDATDRSICSDHSVSGPWKLSTAARSAGVNPPVPSGPAASGVVENARNPRGIPERAAGVEDLAI